MNDTVAPPATTSALIELLARVRAATGPDEWLDISIEEIDNLVINRHLVPRYTASIDSAVAFAERVLPEQMWRVSRDRMAEDDNEPPF